MLKLYSTSRHVVSQPLSKTGDSFVLRKFPTSSSMLLLIQKLYMASYKAFKKL